MTRAPIGQPLEDGWRPLAVTVDLDDTLFAQSSWLDGAWRAVAAEGARLGLDEASLLLALTELAGEGSDRGRIIDRALERVGGDELLGQPLVEVFRSHAPQRLECYPAAREALAALRRQVPVGLVSDGNPAVQRAKLRALDLDDAFDMVVLSDEIGRAFRKPHSAPFRRALSALGCAPSDAVHVGDRHAKDVVGPARIGMRAVRVRTGEYADLEDPCDGPAPWRTARSLAEALAGLTGAAETVAPRPG